jgi:hypothetical protein
MRRSYFVGACVFLLMAPIARAAGPTREELEIQPSGPIRLPERRTHLPAFASEAARQGERRYNYASPYYYSPSYYSCYAGYDYWAWDYGYSPNSCAYPAPRCGYGPLDLRSFVGPVPLRWVSR